MKVKHYLSKAQRKELEDILSKYARKFLNASLINDYYSMSEACESYSLYIDYIKWCGFKIKYYPNCTYKIFK